MKFKKIKDWSFFSKITGLVLFTLIPLLLLIIFYILPNLRAKLIEEKELASKDLVSVALGIAKSYYGQFESSQITEAEAQQRALAELRHIRYGDNDYYWINDLSYKMVMHPIKPELIGQDMSGHKDPEGKYVFREFVDIAKQKGGGVVEYMWPKPGFDKPVGKIAYVGLFKKWGWVIGSGVYIDDIDEEYATVRNNVFIAGGIIVFAILIGSYFFAKKLMQKVQRLKEAANRVAAGDADFQIEAQTEDEFGDLENSFSLMLKNVHELSGIANNIADGKLDVEVKPRSKNDILSISLNKVVTTLKNLVDDLRALTISASNGELHKRADVSKYSGGYKEIVHGINKTLDEILLPINEGISILEVIATGDMTVRVQGDYKGDHQLIKNSINKLGDSLSHVIKEVNQTVHVTVNAANQISSSTEQMAAGAQEQSAQTTEISSSVEEISKTIFETSKNAGEASKNAKVSSNQVKLGVEKINETKKGIDRITNSAKNTSVIIGSLANKTDQIGGITEVIGEIADQTNLLALNAAIEAARAGDQGRGFAVVADEVRKLAERTTKATKEIAETIKAIQKEVEEANKSMVEANDAVNSGITLTTEVEKVLHSISSSVQSVTEQIDMVAAASEQQSAASEQISKNIESISNVTHEAAAGIQQIANSSEELNKLTQNLQNVVAKFKVDSLQNVDTNFYQEKIAVNF